jgi:hypothetical protein
MKYIKNGFHYVILKYDTDFSNTFEFMGWSMYSISKLPFKLILICDKILIQVWAICFITFKPII